MQALARIPILKLTQIKTGTKVFTLAINDGSTDAGGHIFKQVAQCQNEGIVQGITLDHAAQADHGDFFLFATQFELNVFYAHGVKSFCAELWL
jgi:hypothetical protein